MLIWSRKNSWTTDVFEDFVQGKETAFKYFHSLYYRHLLLTTCASIGDMVEAEDVVTDAFVIYLFLRIGSRKHKTESEK